MKEYLDNAKEELKRMDHLIYVSLKYTRTVDVLRSVIDRLMNCLDIIMDGLIERAKKEGKIEDVPTQSGLRFSMVKDVYKDDKKIVKAIDFYLSLKKIMRAKYEKAKEFRRHVKMTADVDGKEAIINIDVVYEHFEYIKSFVEYIEEKYQ